MSDDIDFEIQGSESGASATYPMQCSALRKGGYVMLKGRPCKVMEMSTSKTGKHGHAKVNLVGIDIFNGRKYEDMSPSTHNMDVPVVKRNDYQLTSIEDGYMSLMNDNGELKEDLKLGDDEISKEIQTRYDNDEELVVTVQTACGEEAPVGVKALASK